MNSTSTIAHQKTEQTENIESRIIEAAKQEFIKKGFEQTSMSDIAAVVGINRPTLHYYFRTKDKMFQAVFASIVAKFLPHIDTLYSQLAFPFLSKNLTMKLFFNEDKDTFNAFLQEWKQHIISQITYLLKP